MILELCKALFEWLKNNTAAIGIWAYQRIMALLGKEQQLRKNAELNTKKLENKIEIDKANAAKSDVDIVRDAINEGKRSR